MIKQPRWKTVEYSRTRIKSAGSTVKNKQASEQEIDEARKVIDNWRAAHAFPLHVLYVHLRRMAKGRNGIIVAERLKRLKSIVKKLRKGHANNLLTMQDLGGCRVVVPTISDVYQYASDYDKSKKRHVRMPDDDYIMNPKASGYRSLHRVYKYCSDRNPKYNGMLIEVQFRTHLQHIWATAVETMGLFTGKDIKSGEGSPDVKRFFALVSSLFAIKEKQPVVPGTSDQIDELVNELKTIENRRRYLDHLNGFKVVVEANLHQYKRDPPYVILFLDYKKKHLVVMPFKSSEIETANVNYSEIEIGKDASRVDAVLVRVSSDINELKKAYPNYFSDIEEFVTLVKKYLEGDAS